jgi:beta-glucosidase
LKAHATVTRESAAEGMVLLKNNQALPFPESAKVVAAYGITSYDFIAGGTGSGDVNKAYTVSLAEGLSNAGDTMEPELIDLYQKYSNAENEKNKPDPSNPLAAFMPKIRAAEFLPNAASLKKTAAYTDVAIITLGRTSGEFMDRKIPNDFDLSDNEHKLIKTVCEAFHAAGKKVIVILNIGGVIETASWKDQPDAILLAWQAGQEGGNTVADILCGKVNPSGKLTMTFPLNYFDAPSANNFPFDYTPSFNRETLLNQKNAPKELKRNIDYTDYEEDIYVGYRYYDTKGKAVSYPFGYGLSYTDFEYLNPSVKEDKGVYTIRVEVKNTGKKAGKEVVQLYVTAPGNPSYAKPEKELKVFAKTNELQPDESQTLNMTVKVEDLASFDEKESTWITDSGAYQLHIGNSSRDMKTIKLHFTKKST